MKTYQDLLKHSNSEQSKQDFMLEAITDHKNSRLYKVSETAGAYYRHMNPTIMAAQKIVYNMLGKAEVDTYAANNKVPSRFYFYFITQQVQFLLGNGVSFRQNETKEKLGGAKFDNAISDLAVGALNAGEAYGFWNYDHLEVFYASPNGRYPAFVALFDEENGALRAGIRYWQIDSMKPLRMTLYEEDGYTEYIRKDGQTSILQSKRPYILETVTSEATGDEVIYGGRNYPSFPIIPMYNTNQQSELIGGQETLDAYDLMMSQMVNNIDEGNLVYWVLKNYNGMDDLDDAEFLRRLRTTRVVHTDGGSAGSDVDMHKVEAPVGASESALEKLRSQLFEDFMALDTKAIAGGAATATQIKASYEPLNAKCNLFEKRVTEFVLHLLELVGIEDAPTYTRSVLVNKQEEIQSVLLAAQYLSSEYVTSKVLEVNGDIDKLEDVMSQIAAGEVGRFTLEE